MNCRFNKIAALSGVSLLVAWHAILGPAALPAAAHSGSRVEQPGAAQGHAGRPGYLSNPEVSRLFKESIRYGLAHRDEALQHALKYARDMDVALADKFVGMYVNDWTLDYGDRGRAAIRKLLDEGHRAGIIRSPVEVEFVE